jgi:hypothetical protein
MRIILNDLNKKHKLKRKMSKYIGRLCPYFRNKKSNMIRMLTKDMRKIQRGSRLTYITFTGKVNKNLLILKIKD